MDIKHIAARGRRAVVASAMICAFVAPAVAGTYTLDSCRSMALRGNKELMMSRQRIRKAEYQKREAFAAYLPGLDFAGGYTYNQKNMSVYGSDQYLPVKTFNAATHDYDFALVTDPATGRPVLNPATGQPIPEAVAYLPKDALTFDVHNVFFGAVTLTQPIYMGGKIVAMNKLTGYARQLAEAMNNNEAQNVIYSVDAAYWQVVSLRAKRNLAVGYVDLLDSLSRNVALMLEQGVATRADKLSVDVKLNAARVDLSKVENGLALSRMALAQLCALPMDADMRLADEPAESNAVMAADTAVADMAVGDAVMNDVYARRSDLRALEYGIAIATQQKRVARASMLPNVALVGAYTFSNPNMFNGFSKRFGGAFSIGATITVPLWHWGGNYNRYKAAEVDETLMKLQLEDAREMVTLQVNQAVFRARESLKTYAATRENLASADENLRCATLGFKEGVITADDVMAAQTAWLKANSENIDAAIDVRLCSVYLSKTLGTLTYDD